jgi:hypothetical protein
MKIVKDINKHIFRGYDIRGIYKEEMDEETFNAFCKEHEIEIDDLIEGDNDE